MKFVDLSVPLNENTPVYPGDPKVHIQQAGVLEKDGYEDHYVCVGTHAGTHVDAPSHMVLGGKTLDQIAVDRFVGRGVYLNVGKNISTELVRKADIQEGDIVLFHTGMSDVYDKPEYYDRYPAISEEIAHYLVAKRVKMVGVDMCSIDHEPFPAHRILLRKEVLIIENLTNLTVLGGKQFRLYASPLKLQIDGAPARVTAEILE